MANENEKQLNTDSENTSNKEVSEAGNASGENRLDLTDEEKERERIRALGLTPIEQKKEKHIFLKVLIAGIVLVLAGGGYYLYQENKKADAFAGVPVNAKPQKEDGRVIDYISKRQIDSSIAATKMRLGDSELEKAPYKNSVVPGARLDVYVDGQAIGSGASGVELKDIYSSKDFLFYVGLSARHPEDEEINPNQTEDFNDFTSAMMAMDKMTNKKLTDEELESEAKHAKKLAEDINSPAQFYIYDVIMTLKGKNPTQASVRYLMYANRILPGQIVDDYYNVTDNTKWFDTSYSSKKEISQIVDYVYAMERPRNDEYLGIAHTYVDGAFTTYGQADWMINTDFYPGTNTLQEGQSTIVEMYHYKDISNMMIAEYGIKGGNLDTKALGSKEALYSQYKPSYTWGISPEMEEICSAYYDIVEPEVYKGTFKNRDDAYKKTAKKTGKSYDEVKTAVMTYEYWALSM